jgi:hypothetical protein
MHAAAKLLLDGTCLETSNPPNDPPTNRPLACVFTSRYYAAEENGLALTTLGNYGRVSQHHAHDGAADMVVADALFQRERNVREARDCYMRVKMDAALLLQQTHLVYLPACS